MGEGVKEGQGIFHYSKLKGLTPSPRASLRKTVLSHPSVVFSFQSEKHLWKQKAG